MWEEPEAFFPAQPTLQARAAPERPAGAGPGAAAAAGRSSAPGPLPGSATAVLIQPHGGTRTGGVGFVRRRTSVHSCSAGCTRFSPSAAWLQSCTFSRKGCAVLRALLGEKETPTKWIRSCKVRACQVWHAGRESRLHPRFLLAWIRWMPVTDVNVIFQC